MWPPLFCFLLSLPTPKGNGVGRPCLKMRGLRGDFAAVAIHTPPQPHSRTAVHAMHALPSGCVLRFYGFPPQTSQGPKPLLSASFRLYAQKLLRLNSSQS